MSIIHIAIEYLPEHLITDEIAQAAIDEGNIKILNTLPHKYLNSEVVMSIIDRNNESSSRSDFKLENLPLELRSKAVCEFAIKKSDSNILHTPSEHISVDMLTEMIKSVEQNLKYLHLFPESLWSLDHIVRGINNIYTYTTPSTRYGYNTHKELRRVAIFLSYVPRKLQRRAFYKRLFDTNLTAEHIDEMTPRQFKDKAFYLQIAKMNFSLIPESLYDYDILSKGIKSDQIKISPYCHYGRKTAKEYNEEHTHETIRDKVFEVMDAAMADLILERSPSVFEYLPKKFQSPKRLIMAINKTDRDKIVSFEGNEKLFTEEVCKAYIARDRDLPTLPASIWNSGFVAYCMAHGTNFKWFEQMPQSLQTVEIVEAAMNCTQYNVKYVRPELITLERAKQLHYKADRWSSTSREYVPKHYLTDFCNDTGLDSEYFSGELSYSEFRERKRSFSYCRIGHSFIAFENKSGYDSKDYRVMLTRRTPSSFKPVQIFEDCLGTFHSTWLEKAIADNDPTFVKPSIGKALKPYAINGYFTLKKVATVDGAVIYANNILGGTAYYTALIGGERLEYSSLEKIKEELTPVEEESETIQPAEDKAA